MDLFRVRLNCIDHYQASPTQFDPQLRNNVTSSQKQNEPKVPVIRVFGSTETGQKVCAHIHGAFPYLYIEYTGSIYPNEVGAYIHRLHLSIDHALAVSYRRNVYDDKVRFVARITLIKGIPFYGYHIGHRFYLKIYLLNPIATTRLSDLLRQGIIMMKVFQPFEAHLQFLLQWMADYNLYGCGYIDCSKVKFRGPVPKHEEIENLSHLWHDRSISTAYISKEDNLPRVSHCSLEVDICVQDILNRMEIKSRPLHHDFIERLNPLAPTEKLVHSMEGLWRDETRRRKSKMVDPDPGSSPFPPEVLVSMSADPRNSQRGGWIHEDEYRQKLESLISEEMSNDDGKKPSFESYVTHSPLELSVKTAFEAVEDLYPENLALALGLNCNDEQPSGKEDIETGKTVIDENRIVDFNDDSDFLCDSDEDIMRDIALSQRKVDDQIEQKHRASVAAVEEKEDIGDEARYEGQRYPESLIDPAESERRDGFQISSVLIDGPGDNPCETISSEFSFTHGITTGALIPPVKGDIRHETSTSGIHGNLKRPKCLHEIGYNKRQKIDHDRDSLINEEQKPSDDAGQFQGDMEGASVRGRNSKHIGLSGHQKWSMKAPAPSTVNGVPQDGPHDSVSTPSSQETIKLNGRNGLQLGFPVVKDPQEPSTILRLSQGVALQTSAHTVEKGVTYEGPLPLSGSSSKSDLMQSCSTSTELAVFSKIVPKILSNLKDRFSIGCGSNVFAIGAAPPTSDAVTCSMQEFNLYSVIYQDAYYSNESDVPKRPREWAGREFILESLTVPFLADFDPSAASLATYGAKAGVVRDRTKEELYYRQRRRACKLRSWEIGEPPPSLAEVETWLQEEENIRNDELVVHHDALLESIRISNQNSKLPQVDGPTQKNKHGFKFTQKQKTTSVQHEVQYMTTMSLEVHVNTRGKFVPNPEEDEVQCVFWCIQSDEHGLESNGIVEGTHVGVVILSEDGAKAQDIGRQVAIKVQEETTELDLLIRMVEIVRTHDPDILTGYEVHGNSWGYLIERARLKYDYNLCDEFSRMKSQSHSRFGKDNDKWGFNNTSTIRVTGRHMINIWRAMRSELNLLQYTMENVVFHLLHRRIPHYAWQDLTTWYANGKPSDLGKVLDYYISRVQLDLEILEQNELIPRTSEQARLLGVDFFSVFSRGSQFKVESLMFRIAKPENFILVSPSRKQVGGQNALECLPLVMEPQSAFYNSPLLVLDFQSLYPSIMIAYNYCYSTFLGRIVNWRGISKMGFTELKRQRRLLELLKDHINISPNGIMYVKPEIRKSLLAKMLGEILETRIMVKSGMKLDTDDKTLQRLLNNRQLALKLIANVTYGYTSASFSGRMPCSEIADSIVQTARETLEKAIALIHSVKRWGAEVVYGDTDSLFVYLKGRTKDQAFDIGSEIAKTITDMNPRPVKLKFEKVYFPSVLLAKKRYVGFKYEHKDQTEPEFDAKGIETVRRDGTPAEQKMEEKALKLLFRTADLTKVKSYFQKQCEKIMKGSVSIQDFCFAKEVRLGTYSEKGLPPPGALISTRRMLEDHRAEPQYGERVPYVVITGAPGARLIDRCVAPETLLYSDHIELDAEYYISKNLIPPLERIFNLVGANIRSWYDEMPKVQRIRRIDSSLQLLGPSKDLSMSRKTLESYMKSSSCLVCGDKLEEEGSICINCLANSTASLLTVRTRLNATENVNQDLEKVCRSCSGTGWFDKVKCDSKDCPVFYSRTQQNARLAIEKSIVEPVMRLLQGNEVDFSALEW